MSTKQEEIHPHRVTQVVEKCSRCEEILARRELNKVSLKFAGKFALVGFLGLGLLWGIAHVGSEHASPPKPGPRTTKCYFVRQAYKEQDEVKFHPWEPWWVWESELPDYPNHLAIKKEFKSKQAAWEFILKWNLEPCR